MAIRLQDFQIRLIKDFERSVFNLETKGYQAVGRDDLQNIRIELPFEWNLDRFSDRNWMYQLHAWRMLDGYLNAIHQRAGAERALGRVLDIIQDWYRGNVTEGPGSWSWYDMSTGIRAGKLAYLAHEMRNFDRNISEIDFFCHLVTLHFENLSDPEQLNTGNHGLFQLWGLKSLAAAFPDHQLSENASAYAIKAMGDLVESQLGKYGVHTENSPAYHFFGVSQIKNILKAPDWAGQELEFIRLRLENAEKVKPWLLDVENKMICIGDSSASSVETGNLPSLKEWPHQLNGNLLGAILDGYAVIRTGQTTPVDNSSLLFMTASFLSKTHKHSDCLSFIWQEKGDDIIVDSGKYGYIKGPFRKYFLSTHAHNTVEVNGKSFSRNAKDAYGSGIRQLKPLADGWLIDTEAPHLSDGYTHRRSVIFRPGVEVIVFDHVQTHDRLAEAKNDFTVWWHFPPNVIVSQDDSVVRLSGFQNIDGASINFICNADRYDIEQFSGVKGDRYQGWVSTGYLQAEPAPVVGFSSGLTGDFLGVTILRIDGRSAPDNSISAENLSETIDRLEWRTDVIGQLKRLVRP